MPDPASGLPDVPFCRIHPELGLVIEGPDADAHWDDVVALIAERNISAVFGAGVTDRGLDALSRMTQITKVGLFGAQVTDAGIQHLARMPQLENLDLSGAKCLITDRGLEVLRHLPNLRKFTMHWAPGVTDAGLAHLAACDRLEHVDVLGTPAGDGVIRALAGKPQLRQLATGDWTSGKGIEALHLIPRFKRWHGDEVKYRLQSFDVEPTSLLLAGPVGDEGLEHMAGLEGLAGLNLYPHTPGLTAAGLKALAGLPNLAFLAFSGKRCNDEAMANIAAIPRLRMLMASRTAATDAGFEALSRSTTLEYLSEHQSWNLTGRGFRALGALPALRGLAVNCFQVDDDALARLPHFPSLTELVPIEVPDAGFRHVGSCTKLEDLWCMDCQGTTDAATAHLSGLPSLKSYHAGRTTITDRSLEILSGLTTLERLEFWEIDDITDSGVAALARLPRLREVSFHRLPRVTRAGLSVFGPSVRVTYYA